MSQHIASHTSLRGLAAISVFWGHYSDVFARDIAGVNLFLPHTHLGVDLFFMLSGFVLHHVYARVFHEGITLRDWGRFLRQRLLRIYPLHVATLLAVIVLARFELPEDGQKQLLLHLTLTHAWGMTDVFTFNAPSWSISAEFAAYLLFPLAVLATGSAIGRWLLVVIVLVSGVALWRLGAGSLELEAIGRHNVLLRVSLSFPIGVLMGWAVKIRPPLGAGLASALQGGAIALGLASFGLGLAEMWLIPAFALLVYATAGDRGFLAGVLGLSALRELGGLSYGIYLLQWPIMLLMFNIEPWIQPALPGLWLDLARLVIVSGLLLGTAMLSWRWLEAPMMAFGRRPPVAVHLG